MQKMLQWLVHGFTITYDMLDNLSKKQKTKQKSGWSSKFGFSKK